MYIFLYSNKNLVDKRRPRTKKPATANTQSIDELQTYIDNLKLNNVKPTT